MHRSTVDISPATLIQNILIMFAAFVASAALAEDGSQQLFQPEDAHRIKNVGGIALSPDGQWIAYGVESTNVDK